MQRPSFLDLTPEQQAHFGNGLGPAWLPDRVRLFITNSASWFFKDASWQRHDFGYVVGGDRWDRARCDWKFFTAMLRDACTQDHGASCLFCTVILNLIAVPIAMFLALFFYLAVRIGGQFGSFYFRDTYATLEEVIEVSRHKEL